LQYPLFYFSILSIRVYDLIKILKLVTLFSPLFYGKMMDLWRLLEFSWDNWTFCRSYLEPDSVSFFKPFQKQNKTDKTEKTRKRNKTKGNKTKRNETNRNNLRNETMSKKRNETKPNELKRNEKKKRFSNPDFL
jgi:hypothetical protein